MENSAALYGAMALAQGAFPAIPKNRMVKIKMKSGGQFEFRYADLESILAATRPALAANGLAFFQTARRIDKDTQVLETFIAHKDGGTISSELELPSPRSFPDPKELGAAITYLRRYAASAILGVAADDDLDASGDVPEDDEDIKAVARKAIEDINAAPDKAAVDAIFKACQKPLGGSVMSYAKVRRAVLERYAEFRGA